MRPTGDSPGKMGGDCSQCGPAEIVEIKERIAALKAELGTIEEWDGVLAPTPKGFSFPALALNRSSPRGILAKPGGYPEVRDVLLRIEFGIYMKVDLPSMHKARATSIGPMNPSRLQV